MVEGYHRRNRATGVYFRELYSLTYNINRGEKAPYLEPSEVLLLPGEKKPRKRKEATTGGYTFEQMAEAARKASTPQPTTNPLPDAWPEPLISDSVPQ